VVNHFHIAPERAARKEQGKGNGRICQTSFALFSVLPAKELSAKDIPSRPTRKYFHKNSCCRLDLRAG